MVGKWVYIPIPFLVMLLLWNFTWRKNPDQTVWIPMDWTTLPLANPEDQVAVYYLVSPLLEDQTGKLFEKFNLYHNGFGFFNLNTNFSITVNYDAENIFRAAFFPEIIHYENGTRDLKWINQGGSFVYNGINKKYWETSQSLITIINGSIYNQFMNEFNSQINDTQPYYNMFGISDHQSETIYVPSWDCFDFVWDGIHWLHAKGVHLASSESLSRDYSYFYTANVPLNVTEEYYNNETVRNQIIDMYQLFHLHLKDMEIGDILKTIEDVHEGNFYLRISTDYWKIKLVSPCIDLKWVNTALPGS